MSPRISLPDRLYQLFGEVGRRLQLDGDDPAIELAGRFGLRKYMERHTSGETEVWTNPWQHVSSRMLDEAVNVSRVLKESGVRHFFFKGIALIDRFYRVDERLLADVDLVVHPADRSATLAALHTLGYGEIPQRGPSTRRPGVTMVRSGSLQGDLDDSGFLDVHWGLEPIGGLLPTGASALTAEFWSRLAIRNGLPVPHDEDHAALVLHHLVRHDLLHVRGLLDFALLWNAIPREGGSILVRTCESLGIKRALRQMRGVMTNELHLFPLRGVMLGDPDFRDAAAFKYLAIRNWLEWAARQARDPSAHVSISRSRAWRRFLMSDSVTGAAVIRELVAPPAYYLNWRWPEAGGVFKAWFNHVRYVARTRDVPARQWA